MGLAESDILDNQFGNVVWFGQVKEFDTGSLTLGQTLYFDTSSGNLTATEPTTNKIIVAAVEKVSSGGGSNGILLVRIKWVSRDIAEVDGLTDALAGKSAVGHTHVEADITDLDKYTQSQVNSLLSAKSDVGHTHFISDVSNLQTELDTVGQVDGQSTKLGFQALNILTAGLRYNTAVGYQSSISTTTGTFNTAIGRTSLELNATGSFNTAIGFDTLRSIEINSNNTGIGARALRENTSSNNTASGFQSGRYIADGSTANSTGSSSVFIGSDTKALANGQTNQIVIGHNATGNGSNTATIGNDSITATYLKGAVSATTSVTTPSVVATSTVKIGAWGLSENGTSGSLDFVIG